MVEMYASDWVICMFANLIPISLYADFLDSFLTNGWTFFYTLCLTLLNHFKEKLLNEDDISGILYHIKFKSPEKKPQPLIFDEDTGFVVKSTNDSAVS